jgi:hypothetical protein
MVSIIMQYSTDLSYLVVKVLRVEWMEVERVQRIPELIPFTTWFYDVNHFCGEEVRDRTATLSSSPVPVWHTE